MLSTVAAAMLALALDAAASVDSLAAEPEEPAVEYVEEEPEEYVEEYWEPDYYETTPNYYEMPTDGLTMQGGVNEYDGRTETWYSSNVLYHYRTSEWWVDEEGFYRDADGYYVVAASDMEQGTVFGGSKGECIVLDCGCADGVTDYYVNW